MQIKDPFMNRKLDGDVNKSESQNQKLMKNQNPFIYGMIKAYT